MQVVLFNCSPVSAAWNETVQTVPATCTPAFCTIISKEIFVVYNYKAWKKIKRETNMQHRILTEAGQIVK